MRSDCLFPMGLRVLPDRNLKFTRNTNRISFILGWNASAIYCFGKTKTNPLMVLNFFPQPPSSVCNTQGPLLMYGPGGQQKDRHIYTMSNFSQRYVYSFMVLLSLITCNRPWAVGRTFTWTENSKLVIGSCQYRCAFKLSVKRISGRVQIDLLAHPKYKRDF